MALRTSPAGVEFIASFEGFVDHPYNDPTGNATIGYGHLLHLGPVTKADRQKWGTITAKEGRSLLFDDLERFEQAVDQLVTVRLTQGQFDALVSFAYNVGAGNLRSSTLLKKVNAKRWRQARYQFLRWVFSGGKPLPGLIRRRRAESDKFWHSRPRKPHKHRRFRKVMLNGHPGNVTRKVKRTIVRAVNAGLYVTSTTDGTHAPTSWHYTKPRGRAVDVAHRDRAAMVAFQKAEHARGAAKYRELFGPDNELWVKNGQQIDAVDGSPLENQHDTHVHLAI